MASIREQIVTLVERQLQSVESIQTVERRLETYEGLQQFAVTQFPVACIVAGLPVPREKRTARAPGGVIDLVISDLTIDVYVYFQDNAQTDALISKSLDELWPVLHADPTKGGIAIQTQITPHGEVEFWHPFVAYKLAVTIRYTHDTGGI